MQMIRDKIEYIVMLIAEFSRRNNLSAAQAYRYIAQFKGFELCDRHYGIMHTLPLDDNIDSITSYCRKNGGKL